LKGDNAQQVQNECAVGDCSKQPGQPLNRQTWVIIIIIIIIIIYYAIRQPKHTIYNTFRHNTYYDDMIKVTNKLILSKTKHKHTQ